LKETLRLDPKLADAYYTLGVTLWQKGDFPSAAEQLRKATEVQPTYAEAYYTLGTVLKQMDKLPEAAAALREAVRLQPDFVGAHTTLAGVLRQSGDTTGADAESKIAAEISKEKTGLQAATFAMNSGKKLLAAGDVDGAIAQFRSATKLAPNFAQAHFQLGTALKRKGETGEGDHELKRAAELDPRLVPPGQ